MRVKDKDGKEEVGAKKNSDATTSFRRHKALLHNC